jgi:hypothetical protein
VSLRTMVGGWLGPSAPRPVVVRQYGRDSLLVWANVLLAPLFAALGLRVGLQSDEQLAARIEADSTAMRKRGYLVASVETFTLPVVGAPGHPANWYRVTFERTRQAASEEEPRSSR